MTGQAWIKLYFSQAMPEDLIKLSEMNVKCEAAEAARLINLFDR